MNHANHTNQLARLHRIEGQIAGITRMIEEQRYCVDILTQIRAVRAALRKVEEQVLREHVEHCVSAALTAGDPREAEKKLAELFTALARFAD